jgi:hypothetical protein
LKKWLGAYVQEKKDPALYCNFDRGKVDPDLGLNCILDYYWNMTIPLVWERSTQTTECVAEMYAWGCVRMVPVRDMSTYMTMYSVLGMGMHSVPDTAMHPALDTAKYSVLDMAMYTVPDTQTYSVLDIPTSYYSDQLGTMARLAHMKKVAVLGQGMEIHSLTHVQVQVQVQVTA